MKALPLHDMPVKESIAFHMPRCSEVVKSIRIDRLIGETALAKPPRTRKRKSKIGKLRTFQKSTKQATLREKKSIDACARPMGWAMRWRIGMNSVITSG